MNGYDWDFGFGFGRRYSAHRGGSGYGGDFQGGYDRSYGRGGRGSFARGGRGEWGGGGGGGGQRGFGGFGGGAAGGQSGRWDRGVYGEDYPTFGGIPGGRREGMYYGDRGMRPGSGFSQQGGMGYAGGYDRGWGGSRRGYDTGYAREPFVPEAAYRRHPELDRPQRRGGERWPAQGHDEYHHVQQSDDEIERTVRENLYQDKWVDADRIDVSVEDGVVTLQGEVGDYLEARYAWDDAWEAQGVRGVINQITVRTDLPADEHEVAPQTSGTAEGSATG